MAEGAQQAAAALYTYAGHHHLASDALDGDGLAILTKWTQRWIHSQLHPPLATGESCRNRSFTLTEPWMGGMGSQLSSAARALGYALEHGHQLVFHRSVEQGFAGQAWCDDLSDAWCDHDDRSMQNWVAHPSACGIRDALGTPEPRVVLLCGRFNVSDASAGLFTCVDKATHERLYMTSLSQPPTALRSRLLHKAPWMHESEVWKWWQAQAYAYLLRFNRRTVDELSALRHNMSNWQLFPDDSTATLGVVQPGRIPLAPGAISMHIREGDKGIEMTIVGFDSFMTAAAKLTADHPLSFRRVVFLSGENPRNIELLRRYVASSHQAARAGNLTAAPRWYGALTRMPRINSNGYEQGTSFGVEFMTKRWLLQLLLALECDAFIGNRMSNWNLIIDHLRCTWVPKCNHPFIDVNQGGPTKKSNILSVEWWRQHVG
jgi:hypothetical protein